METVTLNQLAQKLNLKVWEKGDLKRIYIDKGWNTKKMQTNAFIWQNENGDFLVSVKVNCSSQPFQWIKSQEDQVKNWILQDIENALNPDIEEIEEELIEKKENTYQVNQKVSHNSFGLGIISKIENDKIYVNFNNDEKMFLLKFVSLTIIEND